MTRPALLLLLDALYRAQRITEAEAAGLLAAFDAGRLSEADVPALPLLFEGVVALLTGALATARRRIAQASAGTLGLAVPTEAVDLARALRAADRLPMQTRTRLISAVRADDVRGALSREVQTRTRVLFSGRDVATFGPGEAGSAARSAGSVSRWQTALRQAIAEDAATLARLGAGGELSPAQAQRLASVVAGRMEYVDRYAVYLSRMAAGEVPVLSEAQIRAQLVRQSGSRALFFQNAAEREAAGLRFPVAYYRARDTPATCSKCLAAERGGPYLISACPWPGGVCLGGDHCQCEVEVRDDPEAYARLTSASGDGASLPLRAAVAA